MYQSMDKVKMGESYI